MPWQQVAVLYNLAPRPSSFADPSASADIHLGDITSSPASINQDTFATYVTLPHLYLECWRESRRQHCEKGFHPFSATELQALRLGSQFLTLSPQFRKFYALQELFYWLGRGADRIGTKLRTEDADRTKGLMLTSDKLSDLAERARALVEEKEAKDVWLVLEPGVKAGEHEETGEGMMADQEIAGWVSHRLAEEREKN